MLEDVQHEHDIEAPPVEVSREVELVQVLDCHVFADAQSLLRCPRVILHPPHPAAHVLEHGRD
jgi:hypothetical protein